MKENKWNKFEKAYKNNLLNLILFFNFPSFFLYFFVSLFLFSFHHIFSQIFWESNIA